MGQSFEKKKRSGGEGNYLAAVRQPKLIMVCMDVHGGIGTVVGVQASGTWKMIKKIQFRAISGYFRAYTLKA